MVVKVTRARVCDICESEDSVHRYRITRLEGTSQQTVTTDLCVEHSGPVEVAINTAPQPRRGRKSARPVVSVDEIVAKKVTASRRKSSALATRTPKDESQQTSRKPAAKKTTGSRKRG